MGIRAERLPLNRDNAALKRRNSLNRGLSFEFGSFLESATEEVSKSNTGLIK
jgi:hypothetical protein